VAQKVGVVGSPLQGTHYPTCATFAEPKDTFRRLFGPILLVNFRKLLLIFFPITVVFLSKPCDL